MKQDIRETKKKWYIKNRERILKKSKDNYNKKVGKEPLRSTKKKIILKFD